MPRPEKSHTNDDNSQEDFTQLIDGKKVVALPNDTRPRQPDGSYVFVRDETAKTIEVSIQAPFKAQSCLLMLPRRTKARKTSSPTTPKSSPSKQNPDPILA